GEQDFRPDSAWHGADRAGRRPDGRVGRPRRQGAGSGNRGSRAACSRAVVMTSKTDEANPRCCLTTKDGSILEAMLERRIASGDVILPLLRQKLAEATIVQVDEVDAGVVTLNSRVLFRVNDGETETRTLVQQENRGLVGLNLPITTPRGLSMLGMSEGQTVTVGRPAGGQESILIEKI